MPSMRSRSPVRKGLSAAMGNHPRAFSLMYISLIRAGERAGTLDVILEDLAVYLEKIDGIQTKVRSALSYPIFVLGFTLLAGAFLLLKIVPTFANIYADLGQQLPTLTRVVIAVSDLARSNAVMTLALGAALILVITAWCKTPTGRKMLDTAALRVPVFGPIVRKSVMSRFCRTMGVLMRSGLPMLDVLDLVRQASGNARVGAAIEDVREKIRMGQPITASFRSTKVFPEMVLQLMSTGEESGDLDGMLLKGADFYDRQVEAAVHGLASLIEPVMIVLVGAVIGVIVVSMFLPIFYMGEAVMRGGFSF